MREVPLEENPAAHAWAEALLAGRIDVHLCLTGVGTRALLTLVGAKFPLADVRAALARVTIVARGPKPVAALRDFDLTPTLRVPEPNTWRELLLALDRHESVEGKRVSVQEYGIPNLDLLAGLDDRGADVLRVPVYAWALPHDTAPLRAAIQMLANGEGDVLVFTNAQQVNNLLTVAREVGAEDALRRALPRLLVASIGPTCSETLRAVDFPVDFEPARPKMGPLAYELAEAAHGLLEVKRGRAAAPITIASVPTVGRPDAALWDSPFMRACRREPTPYTPIWLMRQAGRYQPEYRELRRKVSMLELCKTPELAAEVTVRAATQLGTDAAIIFSDLLVPLEPMGAQLDYVAGEGPLISNPVREGEDVRRLGDVDLDALAFVYDAIGMTRAALPADVPLLGFVGAPFTLAAYLIEGGGSRNYEHTKLFMYRDPRDWHVLLDKLARSMAAYALRQLAAGAQAVQVFDTWAGALSPADYRHFVLPHTRALVDAVRAAAPEVSVVAAGMSCRQQIAHGTGRMPRHPVELLAEALA
jgi:uroporphyrinogen decarboxylase